MVFEQGKDALRAAALARRTAVGADEWTAEDEARTAALLAFADRFPASVAAVYASRQGEPGTAAIVDGLVMRGWRVLLPVIRREVDWAWFEGWDLMAEGWRSIPQPTGERLGAGALSAASLIVVPCLAVGLDGTRLGTGGGWYDRALLHRRADAAVVALAREVDVVSTVPTLQHDRPVDGFVTEARSTVD